MPAQWSTAAAITELRQQRRIAAPLALMNLTWLAKMTITTFFLGRLGELPLAGGALAATFANVTGFSVLTGLCAAMEPICGQAYGAGNRPLLRKTLLMAFLLLLAASIPIAFLWLNIDAILLRFGQHSEISAAARNYAAFLLPDLVVTSFIYPLRSYLSSQGVTLPILLSSVTSLALHVPLNALLSNLRGLQGVATAVWLSDLVSALLLALYVLMTEANAGKQEELWKQSKWEWARFLRLAAPCCLHTCLEWWCYEILVLLTGRLPNPKRAVGVITIALNFDYLLFSAMAALATAASVRVSNELGAGRGAAAKAAACVSMAVGAAGGVLGGALTAGVRVKWGAVFSKDAGVVQGVRSAMLVMAVVEVVNFPLCVCGGIVRGTGRPALGICASAGGFYVVALPLAVVLGFRAGMGLDGMLLAFLAGAATSAALLVSFVACLDWEREAKKARELTASRLDGGDGAAAAVC